MDNLLSFLWKVHLSLGGCPAKAQVVATNCHSAVALNFNLNALFCVSARAQWRALNLLRTPTKRSAKFSMAPLGKPNFLFHALQPGRHGFSHLFRAAATLTSGSLALSLSTGSHFLVV